MHPTGEEPQIGRQRWIIRDEVAPLAAGDRHLPLHLGDIPAWDGLAQQGLDMGRGERALDLDQPGLADQAVGAGTRYRDAGMIEEADLEHLDVVLEGVEPLGLGLLVRAPLHGGGDEALCRQTRQALADQLGGVVGSRGGIAGLGPGDDVGDA